MAEREDFDTRMQRLRQATEAIEPPPDLALRMVAAARARSSQLSWVEAVVAYARWALVPAVLASALVLAASWTDTGELEEMLYLGSSVGYLP